MQRLSFPESLFYDLFSSIKMFNVRGACAMAGDVLPFDGLKRHAALFARKPHALKIKGGLCSPPRITGRRLPFLSEIGVEFFLSQTNHQYVEKIGFLERTDLIHVVVGRIGYDLSHAFGTVEDVERICRRNAP